VFIVKFPQTSNGWVGGVFTVSEVWAWYVGVAACTGRVGGLPDSQTGVWEL
jgi:hypothetical protein